MSREKFIFFWSGLVGAFAFLVENTKEMSVLSIWYLTVITVLSACWFHNRAKVEVDYIRRSPCTCTDVYILQDLDQAVEIIIMYPS